MRVTTVSVSVKKMFSDGNYGHQFAEVSYTAEVESGENPEEVTVVLLARANSQVAVQLGNSESINIRRALHPRPRVCSYCNGPLGDWDNYSHQECEEQERARRDAERAAQKAEWDRQQEEEAKEHHARSLAEVAFRQDGEGNIVALGPDADEAEAAVAAQGPSDDIPF